MRVTVTGASGHLGGALVRALLRRGHAVTALVCSDRRALEGLDVRRCIGDVTVAGSLTRAFRQAEVVYHLAASIQLSGDHQGRLFEVNVGGTRNVVQACRSCGVQRLVHFSSIHALDPHPRDQLVDETRPLQLDPAALSYDRSKALAEQEVQDGVSRGLEAVILNPCGVIGPLDFKPSAMGQVVLKLCLGQLPVMIQGGFHWVDVRDVAQAAVSAATLGTAGQRYILAGHWRTLSELARMVARAAGVRPPLATCPTWLARLGAPFSGAHSRLTGRRALYTSESLRALEGYRQVSQRLARRDLGYTVRPLEQTVEDTVCWFQEAGVLDR